MRREKKINDTHDTFDTLYDGFEDHAREVEGSRVEGRGVGYRDGGRGSQLIGIHTDRPRSGRFWSIESYAGPREFYRPVDR